MTERKDRITFRNQSNDSPSQPAISGTSNQIHFKRFFLKLWVRFCGPTICLFGINSLSGGRIELGILGLSIGFAGIFAYHVLKKEKHISSLSRLLLAGTGLYILITIFVSAPTSHRTLWAYIFPPAAFYICGDREGTIWTSFFMLCIMVIVLMPQLLFLDRSYDPTFTFRYLISLGLVCLTGFGFERAGSIARKQMAQTQRTLEVSERRYREAYERLKNTQSQLVQSGKLASIGELVSGVAHELNQPLTVIRGVSQLIKRGIHKGMLDPDMMSEQVGRVEHNTLRMMKIINHLRVFSRQSNSNFSTVDINKVINDAFLMVGEQLRLRNIEIKMLLSRNLPLIKGDPNQLEQVILNLITNARDAVTACQETTQKMGNRNLYRGQIEIITAENEPAVRPRDDIKEDSPDGKQKRWVQLLIRDNGCGIPEDIRDKIFDPFFTTKEQGQGTGLGLSISYGILKDHQAEIEAINSGSEGTCFRVRLPVAVDAG